MLRGELVGEKWKSWGKTGDRPDCLHCSNTPCDRTRYRFSLSTYKRGKRYGVLLLTYSTGTVIVYLVAVTFEFPSTHTQAYGIDRWFVTRCYAMFVLALRCSVPFPIWSLL